MKKNFHSYIIQRRFVVVLSLIILALIFFFNNTDFIVRAILTIIFIILFYIIDHLFDLRYRHYHYLFVIIIAVSSFLLSPLYFKFIYYDKVLHFFFSILLSSLIFHLVSKLKLALKWKIVFTFFIVVACLGLFEIGEYILDLFFDFKFQGVFLRNIQTLEKFHVVQSPIDDTMSDLIFGVVGSALYLITAFLKKLINRTP